MVIYKGIDWRQRLTIVVDSSNERANLTGLSVVLQVRRRTGETPLTELSVGSGITLLAQTGDTVGQADIVLPGATSASWDAAGHVIAVLVDGRVAIAPTRVPVRAL